MRFPLTGVCDRYDAARLPVFNPYGAGGHGNERIIMGNVAVAEERAGIEELDELYKLHASESDPEEDGDEEDGDEEDGEGEEVKPDVMPQG
jgi:hypothetical protein